MREMPLGEKDGKRAIIWDLAINSNAIRSTEAVADFESWIKEAHEVVEDWFFTLIEGELKQSFEGADPS